MKKLRYLAEAAIVYLAFAIFRVLPLDAASATGGFLLRSLGPHLAASRKARRNLALTFPDKSEEDREKILGGMWDNLGRVFAEYPHLKTIGNKRITFENGEILDDLRTDGKAAMLFTGHLANWEIASIGAILHYDLPMDLMYRAPNNPLVEKLLTYAREHVGRIETIPKSKSGTKKLFAAMREGRHIGILIDQKYNEGIEADFFGRPAMTSTVFVQFCQKFEAPLVPGQIIRTGGAHFLIRLYDPLPLFGADGEPLPPEDVLRKAHVHLEDWITQFPEQWLWIHRRWKE